MVMYYDDTPWDSGPRSADSRYYPGRPSRLYPNHGTWNMRGGPDNPNARSAAELRALRAKGQSPAQQRGMGGIARRIRSRIPFVRHGKKGALVAAGSVALIGAYQMNDTATTAGRGLGAGLAAGAVGYGFYKSPTARKVAMGAAKGIGYTVASPFIAAHMINKGAGAIIGHGVGAASGTGPRAGTQQGTRAAADRAKRFRPTRIAARGAWAGAKMVGSAAARHPVLAALLVGGTALAGAGAIGAGNYASNTIQQTQMIARYQNAQFNSLQSMAPGSRPQGVAPDFMDANRRPPRQVRGGHMGASGDLVFAMNNRR